MQNAVHLFHFGGFIGTRVLDETNMECLWQDPLFDDPMFCDDGMGWQMKVIPGGGVYTIMEEVGTRYRLFEGTQERRDWKQVAVFDYATKGPVKRGDAFDALSKWMAEKVGFVEKEYEVIDLTEANPSPDALAAIH